MRGFWRIAAGSTRAEKSQLRRKAEHENSYIELDVRLAPGAPHFTYTADAVISM